jgi:hypothetical protein
MIETAIDPIHPRRLEKKANIVAGSSFDHPRTRLFLMSGRENLCRGNKSLKVN